MVLVWDGDGGVRSMRLLRSRMRWSWAGVRPWGNKNTVYVVMRMLKKDTLVCSVLKLEWGAGMFVNHVLVKWKYAHV
jgi:hypothetical protein